MSDGRTHARATIALTIPAGLIAASIVSGKATNNLIMGCVGCLSGLVIEPDLDVDGVTKSEWRMIKRFWILGMVWVTLWYPYAWLLPHRSPFSHWPLLGTAGRVFYMALVISIIAAILRASTPVPDIVSHPLFAPWFIGLCVADTAHFLMDITSTRIKRVKRKWRRR